MSVLQLGRSVLHRRALLWASATLILACSGGLTDVTPIGSSTVATVTISPSSATVAPGATATLQALPTDAGGQVVAGAEIVWTSRDPSIATVTQSGVVKGIAIGSTQVAASANGHSALATITVANAATASVVVTPGHVDAVVNGTAKLTGVALDASQQPLTDRSLTWSTSNATVATVDATGLVTAHAVGTATITGSSQGKSATATITVTQAQVASVNVTPNPLSMSVGQNTQLTATILDQNGNPITGRTAAWTTSNSGVATVSTTGVLTAVAAGSATITASIDGKSGTTVVSVSNFGVGSVSVQPSTVSVVERVSSQLSAVVRDVTGAIVTGRVVAWTSSDNAIATVSPSGLVTGVKAGSATITATSEGVSGTAVITVTLAPVASVVITPPAPSVTVGGTISLVPTLTDIGGTSLTGRTIAWTSSTPAVATVSSTGVVTAVGPGTSPFNATS